MKKVLEIKTIGDTKYHCTAGYFPDNKWLDNDTFVYQRSEDPTIACEDWEGKVTSELVRLSLKDNSEEVLLSDRIFGYHYVIFDDKIYYSDRKNLKVFDIKSKKTDILYTNKDYYPDDNAMALMCPTVTNDGKYISVYISGRNPEHSMAKIIVLETETGHVRYTFEAGGFARPFQYADHVMICPTDPDLVYFCHEGTTEYVSNRMWIYDAKTGKKYNFAKQRLDEDGNLGDCFGHEMWAPDGRGMYFVKYAQSTLKPSGVAYADVKTGKIDIVATGYKYWHVGVSRDGKYLMADTFEPDMSDKAKSEVIVVDLSDGSENVIDIARKKNHPAHPHPQLSPNCDRVAYTSLDGNDRVVLKIAILD